MTRPADVELDPVNGYRIQERDRTFLGITDQQLGWLRRGEAPLGMTPDSFRGFRADLYDALRRDGVPLDGVEVYLKGSCVNLYSHLRKPLPSPADLAGRPDAVTRLGSWLGGDTHRPGSLMFDAMYRLGLKPPSDIDLHISSDVMVSRALGRYAVAPPAGLEAPLHGRYQFVRRALLNDTFPHLADWADRWYERLGREVAPALFGRRHEPLEPDNLEPGLRWQLVGPEAGPVPAAGSGRRTEEQLRVTPPQIPAPQDHPALRSGRRSGIDRALLDFLDTEVNLSGDAYQLLGGHVSEVQDAFAGDPVFGSSANQLYGQGSIFFGTAIEPVAGRGLDIDVLLEMPYESGWEPRRYLDEAARCLAERSAGTVQRQGRNVRVDFSDTVHVDVIPMVTWPSGDRAIVNHDDNVFQPVDPFGIAEWIDEQDERSGGTLRPIVRLMKHGQATDQRFPCPPIMLTIMLGEQLQQAHAINEDSSLTNDLRVLADGLCEATAAAERKPRIVDPSRPDVNFDQRWRWDDYQRFRSGVREFRDNLVKALAADPHGTRPDTWAPVFGKDFARFLEQRLPMMKALTGLSPVTTRTTPSAARPTANEPPHQRLRPGPAPQQPPTPTR